MTSLLLYQSVVNASREFLSPRALAVSPGPGNWEQAGKIESRKKNLPSLRRQRWKGFKRNAGKGMKAKSFPDSDQNSRSLPRMDTSSSAARVGAILPFYTDSLIPGSIFLISWWL